MSVGLMLIAPLLFSQSTYPSKTVINSDTVCVISIEQAKEINVTYLELDQCMEVSDTLKSIIVKQNKVIGSQTKEVENLEKQIKFYNEIDKANGQIILDLKSLDKKSQSKIKWLKIQRNVVSVILLSSIGAILIR